MAGYLQLDREVLNSTVWVGTDSDTKALWFFLLLAADMRTGIVHHTLPAISRDTGIPREKIDSILVRFSSPDPDSRTKDNEGRRIKFIDSDNPNGGILVLNYGKYRDKHLSQSADRMRRHRAAMRDATVTGVTSRDATVTKEKEKEKELTPLPPAGGQVGLFGEEMPAITVHKKPEARIVDGVKIHPKVKGRIDPVVVEIFKFWAETFKKNPEAHVLDKGRYDKIQDALAGHTVDELKRCIRGVTHSKFNMGENTDKKKWIAIDLIFRNEDKISEFLALHDKYEATECAE